eukprot:TRINITY_DN29524_c0_g1_i1.p1 TRINITY_DN29524_c0_g1~~TRINITY_DN29524_c0_g1_i1.p1  ORF type:complete len:496 (-),score=117.17 TRINITY_DN29524_c0_g1_i1:47-1480(-)
MSELLRVHISSLAGRHLDLDLLRAPASSIVLRVKEAVQDAWAVPVICQRLVMEDYILEDGCEGYLSSRPSAAGPQEKTGRGVLNLQLVVSVDELRSRLQSALAPAAILSLASAACLSDGSDIQAWSDIEQLLWENLEHSDADVQAAVAHVLGLLTRRGRPSTRREVMTRVESAADAERAFAVGLLGQLPSEAEHSALPLLRSYLEDASAKVRAAAVYAISQVADPSNEGALFALSARLHDVDASVRLGVANAFGVLASAGGCFCGSVTAVAEEQLLTHKVEGGPSFGRERADRVRDGTEAAKTIDFVLLAVTARLQHPDAKVRGAVAQALRAALHGMSSEACRRCGHPEAAVAAAETAASTWPEAAADAICCCFHDDAAAVRAIALQALADLPAIACFETSAPKELLALSEKALKCMSDPDANVRSCAVRAVARLALQGDVRATATASLQRSSKKDPDISVRSAAKMALCHLGVDPC